MNDKNQLAELARSLKSQESIAKRQILDVVEQMKDSAQLHFNMGEYILARHLTAWAKKIELVTKSLL